MINFSLLGHGRTADVYEYGEGKILKLFKQDLPQGSIYDEFSMSRVIYQLGVNTPKPNEIIHLEGRIGIVYERISGITILHMIKSKPWLIIPLSKKLAELHVILHKYVADGLQSQKEFISRNINQAASLSVEEKAKIIQYLTNLPSLNIICHGDFHPDNVMIDHYEDSWIIDWMTGMAGNPAGDVARTILLLKLGTLPEETPWMSKVLFAGIRKVLTHTYLKHYLKQSAISLSEIDQWILPVAAARLIEWIPEEEKRRLLVVIKDRLRVH